MNKFREDIKLLFTAGMFLIALLTFMIVFLTFIFEYAGK